MSYALRNTIILTVLVILVNSIGWFFIVIPTRKEKIKIQSQLSVLTQKLIADANLANDIVLMEKEIKTVEKRWLTRKKILPIDENSRITYSFINRMVDTLDNPFPFDFDFNGEKDTLGVTSRKYSFRADVPYASLDEFIFTIERHKRLLVIPDFQLDFKPPVEGEPYNEYKVTVHAKMVAYSAASGSNEIPDDLPEYHVTPWNPFRPLVVEKLPKNEEGLLEVDGAKLIAILKNKAYIQDKNNVLTVLEEGDPVYLGFLTTIDPVLAKVKFTLNYGGFIRIRELDLVREVQTKTKSRMN
ncbi:MAG: hypothetical protein N2450_02260 [bacterium]|nr:hypothetical protein [bacterium]